MGLCLLFGDNKCKHVWHNHMWWLMELFGWERFAFFIIAVVPPLTSDPENGDTVVPVELLAVFQCFECMTFSVVVTVTAVAAAARLLWKPAELNVGPGIALASDTAWLMHTNDPFPWRKNGVGGQKRDAVGRPACSSQSQHWNETLEAFMSFSCLCNQWWWDENQEYLGNIRQIKSSLKFQIRFLGSSCPWCESEEDIRGNILARSVTIFYWVILRDMKLREKVSTLESRDSSFLTWSRHSESIFSHCFLFFSIDLASAVVPNREVPAGDIWSALSGLVNKPSVFFPPHSKWIHLPQ